MISSPLEYQFEIQINLVYLDSLSTIRFILRLGETNFINVSYDHATPNFIVIPGTQNISMACASFRSNQIIL